MNTSAPRIDCARVSTADQTLDARVQALRAAGCTMIRSETSSGATLDGCPELKTLIGFIHPGESLVVTRIDRLARSADDRLDIERKACPLGCNRTTCGHVHGGG